VVAAEAFVVGVLGPHGRVVRFIGERAQLHCRARQRAARAEGTDIVHVQLQTFEIVLQTTDGWHVTVPAL
jgi:hypothetical protein